MAAGIFDVNNFRAWQLVTIRVLCKYANKLEININKDDETNVEW